MEIYRLLKLEKESLEKFLKKTVSIDEKIKEIYSKNPQEIKDYIIPVDVSDEDYIQGWISTQFNKKYISEEVTTYKTNRNEYVRSKSELNIANTLSKMGVPYVYEKPFTLYNGQIIYPDFTLLDIRRRKEIYWEHRGMMDDVNYAINSVQRIKQLNKSGVVIGDNLIITEETKDFQLGTDEIERIVELVIY